MSIVTHPWLTVYTGPAWLMQMFNGFTKGVNRIQVVIDPNGKPIIGTSIAQDPTWDLQVPITNPETNITKPLIDWLEEIPYCYQVEE